MPSVVSAGDALLLCERVEHARWGVDHKRNLRREVLERIAGSDNNTATLAFAPVNTPVTANVVYVGRGCPGDAYLANPSGKIALIDRGTCAVSLKIDAAATAGATGVLIGLVAPGDPISFGYGGGSTFVPSLVITQATSNTIKNTLASSPVNATISPDNAIPTPGAKLCGPG